MIRIPKVFLIGLGILTVAFILIKNLQPDKRTAYEQYLDELYQEFASKNVVGMEEEGQPDQAHFHNFIQTLDPKTKSIPNRGLLKAVEKTELMRQSLRTPRVEGTEGSTPLEWTNIPANLSGRVRAIAIDPVRADDGGPVLWAGSVTGGLWRNNEADNPNSHWEQVHTGLNQNISISAITFDPSNPDHIYVGTGESYTAVNIYRESSAVGTGIWKSEDHGETWTQLASTSDFPYINDILIREELGKTAIYAAVVSGIYKGGEFDSNPSDGLFRSEDGGVTWQQVLPNIPETSDPYSPSDIELTSNGRLLVGTMRNREDKGAGRILHSTDGFNWTVYDRLAEDNFAPEIQYYPGRVIIKAAPSDPNRVYAMVSGGRREASTGWIRDIGHESVIAQSFNGGADWFEFALPDETLGQWSNITWHAAALAVDPSNANSIILSALRGFRLDNTNNADMNSGMDWSLISNWLLHVGSKYIHADHHQILFDEEDVNRIYFSTDGGVFTSNNAQAFSPDFQRLNKSLNTLQYYTLALSGQVGSDLLLAGTQDNNTLQYVGNPVDIDGRTIGGDGAYCFIDADERNLRIASSQWNNFAISFDGMQSITRIQNRGIGIFINPADYDSKNNMLFTNKIGFRLGNTAPSTRPLLRVKLIGQGMQEEFLDLGHDLITPVSNIKVSPYATSGATNLFFGTQSGRLFQVINAHSDTPTATEITGNNFPTSNISSIDVGASNDELLVTFSNFGVQSVWYTDDGGDSWESIEDNLPDMPVRWGLFNPLDRNQVFLATELGVWSKELSGGSGWIQEINGMSDVRVDMIKIREVDGWMVAASHGRGLFETHLKEEEVVTSLPELPKTELLLYPNPTSELLTVQFEQPLTRPVDLKLVDGNGREMIQEQTSQQKTTLNVSTLPKGLYILQVNTGTLRPLARKVLIQ